MYEAHKWEIGEEITSEKLNHIEKGIEEAGLPREITNPQDGQILKYDAASGKWVNGEGGGSAAPLLVTWSSSGGSITLDKTWQEIYDAMPNVILWYEAEGAKSAYNIKACLVYNNAYVVIAEKQISSPTATNLELMTLVTDSASGYPVYNSGGNSEY